MAHDASVGWGTQARPRHDHLPRLVVGATFVVLGLMSFVLWREGPNPFVLTQWHFTFGDGLLRRSLVGSVFRGLGGSTDAHAAAAGVGVALTAMAVLSWVLAELAVPDGRLRRGSGLVALTFAVSPAGFPFLAANVGKFDAVHLILVCGLVLVGLRESGRGLVVLAAAVSVVGTLVHEVAVVTVVPWLAGWCALRRHSASENQDPGWRTAAPILVAAGITTMVLVTHRPTVTPEALRAVLDRRTGTAIPLVTEIPHLGPAENVELVWAYLQRDAGVRLLALDVLSVVPVIVLCLVVARRAGARWSRLLPWERWMVAASVAPLGLVLFGTDFGRWCSASALLTTLTTLVVLRSRQERSSSRATVALGVVALAFTMVAGGTTSHAFGFH